jgi:hypothetical protein
MGNITPHKAVDIKPAFTIGSILKRPVFNGRLGGHDSFQLWAKCSY